MLSFELKNNIRKIYLLKFFGIFQILMPVIVPFFQTLNIGMKGVYLLQSVFAITVFVLEIPSGYISDLLGRKKTLLVANFLKALGFSLLPLATDIDVLILAEVILGLGLSLTSGTDTAIIYDTLDVIAPKKAAIKVLGRALSFLSLGEGVAALAASLFLFLAFSLHEIAVLSAAIGWIPFFIGFTLVEPPRRKMTASHSENFRYIAKSLFKRSRLLNLIIINSVYISTSTLFAVWMFQKYWEEIGVSITYFGFLWALTNFTVSFFSHVAHKVEKKIGSASSLALIGLLPIGGYFGIAFIDSFWGILVCLLFQICRGLNQVILKDALNKRVTGDYRATANSIVQMGVRILFVIGGPLFGHFIDTKGISTSMTYMGMLVTLGFVLFMVPFLRERKNFEAIK